MPADTSAEILAPLLKVTTVGLAPAQAFELFTSGIHRWWPLGSHSVFQDRAVSVAFEPRVGGRLYETRDDGKEAAWGRVVAWEAPSRLVFTWHPGRDASTEQEVEVRFIEADGGTRVQLEHRDWHKLGGDAIEMRSAYESGWDPVLERYRSNSGRVPG